MSASSNHLQECGETLMGLLVGLSVGLVVLAAGSAMLAHHLRGHRAALQDSHLHTDLRSAMDWMARELRKAQYSAHAWESRSPAVCSDAFCGGMTNFSINGSEINFSHDRDHDGQRDDDECMGYRLSANALMARRTCSGNGNWQAITDRANMTLTSLSWQLDCELRSGWLHRSVHMRLTAQWPGDATQQINWTKTVHLRNALPGSQLALVCP
jgi:type II secretory pathway component PulJ